MGAGEIATLHYGQNFTVDFRVYLYEDGKGHVALKYKIPMGDIDYKYDEIFSLKGTRAGIRTKPWIWVYICKCKRRTRVLFMGRDHAFLCRYCLGVRSFKNQNTSWQNIKIAQDPKLLKKFIRCAYTPAKQGRAIEIYLEFLKRMVKAIRSKHPGVFLNQFKK